jgi:hypothetical protein
MPAAPRTRLNGWIRIGIVLSIAWMLYVSGAAAFEYADHRPPGSNFIEWRGPTGETYATLVKTTGMFVDLVPLSPVLRIRWFTAALLVPVVLFWFVAFIVVYAVRWIFHGFARPQV